MSTSPHPVGAPRGNHNALKHGFYSNRFTVPRHPTKKKLAPSTSPAKSPSSASTSPASSSSPRPTKPSNPPARPSASSASPPPPSPASSAPNSSSRAARARASRIKSSASPKKSARKWSPEAKPKLPPNPLPLRPCLALILLRLPRPSHPRKMGYLQSQVIQIAESPSLAFRDTCLTREGVEVTPGSGDTNPSPLPLQGEGLGVGSSSRHRHPSKNPLPALEK